jgi:broad specificity phosphatase PhoE
MKIFFIRHGQTTGDIEDRYGGDYDDHLTELGREQATRLTDSLINRNIDVLFVSPLIRAKETADIVNSKIKAEIISLPEIKERNHNGILSGLTRKEAMEKYPAEVEKVKNYKTTATKGEEYVDFAKRINTALDKIKLTNKDIIGVLTHGGPIKYIYRDMLKIGEVNITDCGYVQIETDGNNFKILEEKGIEYKR